MAPTMPIAIVGMSCRLSGNVSTLEDFWLLVTRSRDGWTSMPDDRFSSDAFYHPNPQKKGCFNQKGGYFIQKDLSQFDAPFFHITEEEAIAMDPQQRQLLECTYEALENAGLPMETISGSNMGVFIGGTASDYRLGTLRDLNSVPMFDATGNHQSIQSGRLSYYFNLKGPCFSVDTACSSSLYALHLAVQSIRSGESDSAVVAGCNLHLQPDDSVSMSMLGIFNEKGRTFSFDHRANSGYARGEGVGCLILKPLDQALRDNDKIRSVIVNTGTGQDGKTVGLSTPSGEAQEQLIRDVYSRAGISPTDAGFVEAHGTGTKVGDPIEARAIHRVFGGSDRTEKSPLYMGSSKSNFGHLENASGIVSIIKSSLMLEKGFVLPNVNYERTNPAIPLDDWHFKVPTTLKPWPRGKRFISINNFGFGGSNAHAVLEHAPIISSDSGTTEAVNPAGAPKLFVFSGNDESAAKRVVAQVGNYIEQRPDIFEVHLPRDMAYTLGTRRSHFPYRVSATASSCGDLAQSLNSSVPQRASSAVPRLAFVFTGQGAQWPEMGRQLMETHPIFAETVKAASDCLTHLGADFDLMGEIFKSKDQSIISHAEIAQPACTAIQLGLVELLKSWDITPSMTIGHSSGEVVAAYAAGAISLEDSMAVAYYRGQVAASLKVKYPDLRGAMLAVGAGAAETKKEIKLLGLAGKLTVACENSPNSVTVSGDNDAIDELAATLEGKAMFNRKLRVDIAYHSAHMRLVMEEYMETICHIIPKSVGKDTLFFSSLLGKRDEDVSLGAAYWVNNLVQPVLFSTAFEELYRKGKPDIVIEVGPHSALEGPIKQILKGIDQQAAATKYFSCLIRNKPSTETAIKLAGNLFVQGFKLNFDAINEPDNNPRKPQVLTDLPSYPWSSHKYWFESRSSKNHRLKPFARHDLLGSLDDSYRDTEPVWRNVLFTDDVPWLKDHQMQGLTTFPLAGYLCIAVEACSQRAQLQGISLDKIDGFRMREVQVSKAFIMEDATAYEVVTSVRAQAEGTRSYSTDWDEFVISSWTAGRGWLEHCRGLVGIKKVSENLVHNSQDMAARLRKDHAGSIQDKVDLGKFYAELLGRGAGYQSIFKLETECLMTASTNYSAGTVVVPDAASVMASSYEAPSILSTSFIDLFFQFTFAILGAGRGRMPTLFMPAAIQEFEVSSSLTNHAGDAVQVIAHGTPDKSRVAPVDFSIEAWNSAVISDPVVKIKGFKMVPVNDDDFKSQEAKSLCYKVEWEPLAKSSGEKVEVHELKSGQSSDPSNHKLKNGLANGHSNGDSIDLTNSHANGHTNGLTNGHTNGLTNGHTNGLTNGHSNGLTNGHTNGLTNGHTNGLTNGHTNGLTNGHTNGLTNGHTNGLTNGHTNGLTNGHTNGFTNGHTNGFTNGHTNCLTNGHTNGFTNGHANGLINGQPHSVTNQDSQETNDASMRSDSSDIFDQDVIIITNRTKTDTSVSTLADLIRVSTGKEPTISPLGDIQPSPSISYICLLEMEGPILFNMSSETFEKIQAILLNGLSMLWVSNGGYRYASKPENNIAQGLLRTVRSETQKVAASLDLDNKSSLSTNGRAQLIADALRASFETSKEGEVLNSEFAEQDGTLAVPRVIEDTDMNLALFREMQEESSPYLQDFDQPGRRFEIVVGTPGALDSLYWQDEPALPLEDEEIEIKIMATGMNFKDVVIAMGQVPSPYLGVECSGIVSRVGSKVASLHVGDRVCAVSLGAYGTYSRCLASSAALIPEEMDFETAASVPVIYSTAYYGLIYIARMKRGDKVLIHAASGGVGQAAIQLAQMIGAEIYATVGSPQKKKLLMEDYAIPEERIFYSRNTEFGPAVRAATDGKGVDIVLNSLAADMLRESWATLAPFGHFIEIGKKDILSNTRLEMAKFEHNCSFSSVDLTLLATDRPRIMGTVLTSVMDLLREKAIQPIGPISVFPISEVESALRKLQSGKIVGKVIIGHSGANQQVKATHQKIGSGRTLFKEEATYVIIGGTGGIGRSLAKRMAERGARHVVLLSRKGVMNERLLKLVEECQDLGTNIYVKSCDVSDAASVHSLVVDMNVSLPPIRGVVHAAMVLKDVLFEKMTADNWNEVVRSKIHGGWNFHCALAHEHLDFFVMLSSVAGIVGNRGQAAYAAANTYLDSLAAYRRRLGLKGTSLNLAAVDDIGFLSENAGKRSDVLKNLGSSTVMTQAEVLVLIEAAIDGSVGRFSGDQCITGLDFNEPTSLPFYASDGKFSGLKAAAMAKASPDNQSSNAKELTVAQKLGQASDVEEAKDIITLSLLDKLGAVLMLPPEVMEAQQGTTSITAFGLDSLTAIELRNWIGKEMQTHLQVLEILTAGKIRDMAGLILKKTRLAGVWSNSK